MSDEQLRRRTWKFTHPKLTAASFGPTRRHTLFGRSGVRPVSDGKTHAFAVVFTANARHWAISSSKLSPSAALRIDFGDFGESISPRYTRCRISAYGGSRFAR
jgi:hypothetical protein